MHVRLPFFFGFGKSLVPRKKAFHLVGAVGCQPCNNIFQALFPLTRGTVLGKKFVGIADDLLFQGFRQHIPWRQRKIVSLDIGFCQPDPHMPLANPCMAGKPHRIEYFPPQVSMADVGLFACAPELRGVCQKNADIGTNMGIADE